MCDKNRTAEEATSCPAASLVPTNQAPSQEWLPLCHHDDKTKLPQACVPWGATSQPMETWDDLSVNSSIWWPVWRTEGKHGASPPS